MKKKKTIPDIRVKDIPFITGKISYEEKLAYGMIMSNGKENFYRIMFAKGQGGSKKESSWNRNKHQHDCCQSKVPWRHRTSCKNLTF